MHSAIRTLVFAALALSAPIALYSQVVGGSITGVVTDASGSAIRGAQVVVHNTETGSERHLVTGADGRYSAPSVTVGRYDITVASAGFGEQKRTGVVVTVGQSNNVDIKLAVGAVSEKVEVDAAPPTINISTQQISGLVDERQVKELPLNGRSYDQLILLNPGTVNYTNQRSGGTGTSNSSVGNMFSISGRRPQDNIFLLNGVEYTGASLINVTPGGTSGQLLGVDAVREFNVITDTYGAGYGKRDGAQISIVTASGTNNVHGDVYEFARNSYFDARNFFDGTRIPEFQRNSFGGALGGPIKKDKLFLFANYEGFRQNLGLSLVTDELDPTSQAKVVASVKPLLNLWPSISATSNNWSEVYVGGVATGIAAVPGTAPQHIREDFGTTRVDYNVTPKDSAFAVYTIDDSTAHTPSADPFSVVDERLREQVLSAQNTHTFSSNLINISRVGYSRASYYFLGSVPAAQAALVASQAALAGNTGLSIAGKPIAAVVIAGSTASNGASSVTTAGVNVGSNNGVTRNLFTADDHVYWTLGKHVLEIGVWVQRLQSNDNLQQDQDGQASFASLSAFEAGTIKSFTYGPSFTELGWRATYVDGYIEDTFHVLPRVELRAGFRSESSTGWNESQGRAGVYTFTNGIINSTSTGLPTSTQSDALSANNALFLPEPRLGVAWDVFGNGKTSIRAGAGLHHSLLDALDYRLDQAAPYNTIYVYKGTAATETVATPLGGAPLISPSTVQTNIATPSLLAYSFKLEEQIARSTSLTVGYSGSHSYHQILNGDLNEPSYVIQNGTVFYPTTTALNPAVANTTSWWSGGTGNYNALIVDLRHDLSHGLQFRANYTWSKNLDDGSAWNTSVSSNTPAFVAVPSLPHLDYGPAATDIRNIGAVNATYELPFGEGKAFLSNTAGATSQLVSGWSLASIASFQSGFPFSPQLGYNPTGSGDSRNPVRPGLNPAFSGPIYTGGSNTARTAQYFNINAYIPPAYGTVGNAGRDSLNGPNYADWDVSLLKSTHLTEKVKLQLRAEFFNVLNHTNLSLPNEIVYSAGPTQGNAAAIATAVQANAPNITSTAGTSRQIQLGAKVTF